MPEHETPVSLPAGLAALLALLAEQGERRYGGEAISQLAHALQCATLAERDGAPAPLVVAALLHDVGHLLPRGQAGNGDDRHEESGADLLGRFFGADVVEPVRLHVAAKRYLCATEHAYRASLSPTSQRSLALQGGVFDARAAAAFAAQPYAESAVALRRWDEAAKDPAARPFVLDHFVGHIERCACLARRRAADAQ
ncbi:MAG: HD domain-containing protein [Rhodospirillaceae bacterium]|nr:HD domain-containing protein [Rhodospirillaceae bacterium]